MEMPPISAPTSGPPRMVPAMTNGMWKVMTAPPTMSRGRTEPANPNATQNAVPMAMAAGDAFSRSMETAGRTGYATATTAIKTSAAPTRPSA